MIELQHILLEPTELRNYRRRNPDGSWDDPAVEEIRPPIRHQLNLEQDGLCVYCECLLHEDEGHIEHIKPKSLNPHLTFEYTNLAHSCNEPKHCGHHKGRQSLPVEPQLGCNRFFSLMSLDGRLTPGLALTVDEVQQANDTIHILGLNTPSLTWQRKQYAETIYYLCQSNPADVENFIAESPFRWLLRGLNS